MLKKPIAITSKKMRKIGKNILLLTIFSSALTACVTREINTRVMTTLPIPAGTILVVYEVSNLDQRTPSTGNDYQQKSRARIVEVLGKSVEKKIPSGLQAQGFKSSFTNVVNVEAASIAEIDHIYELRVRAVKDNQVCTNLGSCSHQLTVRASILKSGSKQVLWSTEMQEPDMVSSFIYETRYDQLADNILKSVSRVVKAPN